MLFTVIIPTYNRASLLKRCLQSLYEQHEKDFEVIVCDDGSTDNTFDITNEFTSLLNLKYIKMSNSGGPAKPRNEGLANARGDWICFLDSDDWWYPNKLSVCKKFIADADIVYHDMDIRFLNSRKVQKLKSRQLKDNVFEDLLMNSNAIINSSVVIRKSIANKIGKFSEIKELVAVEDYEYWIRLSKITSRFRHIPISLGTYWMGAENISVNESQVNRLLYLYNLYRAELKVELQEEADRRIAFRVARLWQKFGNKHKALNYFSKALKSTNLSYKLKSYIAFTVINILPKRLWKKL